MIVVRVVVMGFCLAAALTALAGTEVTCPIVSPCRFGGLADQLATDKPLNLLMVHGMGHHESAYSDNLISKIAKELKLTSAGKPEVHSIEAVSIPHPPSLLRITSYNDARGIRKLRVHELTWSPVVDGVKRERLGYDGAPEHTSRRVGVNNALKIDLIDQRLANPVLYLGPFGDEMRHPIKQALCRMMAGRISTSNQCDVTTVQPSDSNVALITFSLGSRMAFDALNEIAAAGPQASRAVADLLARTSHVYMLANQLPLLDLGHDAGSAGALAAPPRSLAGVLAMRSAGEAGLLAPLTIVAISDPNDLLSYSISSEFATRHSEAMFANVNLFLARRWFRKLANPLTAHTGHDKSNEVVRFIAFGHR